MRHRFILALLVTGVILATVRLLSAHDFWLVPDAFAVGKHSEIVVRGQTSSAFPTSESAVAPERLTEARILGAAGEETIAVRAADGRSLVLRHRPTTAGQKIVVASLGWRHVQESAESFRRYLVLEGADDALKRYEQQGKLPTDAVVRRYAKYAKTSVQFGEGPPAFDRVAGQPLEFIPLTNPDALRADSEFRVRLLLHGKPLASARIHVGVAPTTNEPSRKDSVFVTTNDGVVSARLHRRGLWNVRTIHVVPSPSGADADWDVHWASYVFGVK